MAGVDEKTIRAALLELEQLITTRVVVSEPISIGGATVIPLCSVGFGLGAGRGGGAESEKTDSKPDAFNLEGWGSGIGLGGGVRPVAVIISDDRGVRVESVRDANSFSLDTLASQIRGDTDKADQ